MPNSCNRVLTFKKARHREEGVSGSSPSESNLLHCEYVTNVFSYKIKVIK